MIYLFRVSFAQQVFLAGVFFLIGFWSLSFVRGTIAFVAVPLIIACWFLSYRALRNGFRLFTAHLHILFGRS